MRMLFAVCLLASASAGADPFNDGVAAYNKGAHQDAANLFEQAVSLGNDSPEVFYNLGNAYAKQDRYTAALLNYYRAIRRAPTWDLPAANAEVVRESQGRKLGVVLRSYTPDRTPVESLSKQTPALVFVLLVGLGNVLLLLLVAQSLRRRVPHFAIWALAVILLALGLVGRHVATRPDRLQQSLVMVDKIQLRETPDTASRGVMWVFGGEIVQVEGEQGVWVRLNHGEIRGWVPKDSVDVID